MRAASCANTVTVMELMKEGPDIHMQNKVCCLYLRHYLVRSDELSIISHRMETLP